MPSLLCHIDTKFCVSVLSVAGAGDVHIRLETSQAHYVQALAAARRLASDFRYRAPGAQSS